jgi:predicted flap endonuclease-1-like 5' DNA nuclease
MAEEFYILDVRLRADVRRQSKEPSMTARDDLEQIPGVGKSIAAGLRRLGVTS